jgi:putative mRNA 3-end processing factor
VKKLHVFEKNGVRITGKTSICIDPEIASINAEHVLITHAHSDHAKIKKNPSFSYWMTNQTFELLKTRKRVLPKIKKVRHSKKIVLKDLSVSFHNSGHILGSSQVLFEGTEKIVVTSDFKLQDSILFKKAEILNCDTLILESTFGKPEFVFPERESVYHEIGSWIEKNSKRKKFSILCGYSIGKAQELTKIVNEYSFEIPLVHESIAKINRVYEANNVKLGDYFELKSNLNDSNVLIMPPHLISINLLQSLALSLGKKVECAVATGWKNFNGFKTFPLSDHADFLQLLEYVKIAEPKQVFTYHGFARELAIQIKKRFGINSKPLNNRIQKNLFEFD